MKMHIFIEPEDVWLFRDGKPFDAGSDHRAHSLFPPYPNVMQGVIRSHQIILQGIRLNDTTEISEKIGTSTDYKNFSMRGPFVAKRDGEELVLYFPVPADATPLPNTGVQARPPNKTDDDVTTSHGNTLPALCFASGEPSKKEYGAWLAHENLLECLNGNAVTPTKEFDEQHLENSLFRRESRFGIEIEANRKRATKEGQLYQAEFIRPCQNVGLYVEFDGYEGWPESGLLRMGGEGHAGRYQSVRPVDWREPDENGHKHFKVYFATPAYFSKGWRPERWEDFFEGDVTLEAAALKGYETIGGYDVASNRQKAAYRFVPAGSVYHFSSVGGAKLKKEAFTDALPGHNNIGQIGFGQAIVMEM